MEIRYRREMNHNYMIIEAPAVGGNYECRMLEGNTIEGLLKFRVCHREDRREFYYEITSHQPLARSLDRRKASEEEIRCILLGIAAVTGRIEEFLLKEDQLLLDPEYIYVNPDRFDIALCLLPGASSDFPSALSKLLQFILEKADHQDRDGMMLAYNLYQESLKENYGAADLLRHLSSGAERIFGSDESEGGEEPPRTTATEPPEDQPMSPPRKLPGDQPFGPPRKLPGNQPFGPPRKLPEDQPFGPSRKPLESVRTELPVMSSEHAPMKEKQSTNSSAEPEIRPVREGRTGSSYGRGDRKGVRYLLFLAAAGGAVWYLTGRNGLILYGIAVGAMLLLVLAAALFRRVTGRQKGTETRETEMPSRGLCRDPSRQQCCEPSDEPFRESSWELRPEREEDYREETLRKEKEQMERSREEGTALLMGAEASGTIAVLEALNREYGDIEIPYVPFIIGKHRELSDYCLIRPTISRLHLRIDKKENVCIVTDLNSTNGTRVNDYELQSNETVSVKTGDIIYLADIGFRFREGT